MKQGKNMKTGHKGSIGLQTSKGLQNTTDLLSIL
jgi:hypothetical protein